MSILQQRLKQLGFTQMRLYKHLLYPAKEEVRYLVIRHLRPDLLPTVVTDLKALARERGWPFLVHQLQTVQQRKVSNTITEDAINIIRKGRALLNKFDHLEGGFLTKARVKRAEMYYSHLYAITRYPIYETFACEIPDALITNPSGVIITAQNEVLAQSVYNGFLTKHLLMSLQNLRSVKDSLPGLYISLVDKWSKGYAHWLLDALPKLDLVDITNRQIKVVLPTNPKPYQMEALQLLGFTSDRIVEMSGDGINVETCLLAHAAQHTGVPSAIHLLHVRDRLLQAAVRQEGASKPHRRLYVSRAKSRRSIVNEEQLMPILRHYNFETVFCEDLSFTEQIRLFAEANTVLGAHGAGMHNIMFCPQRGGVIEIFNRQRWDHTVCRLASIVDYQHWHIWGDNVNANYETWVDPHKLKKILEYALENEPSRTEMQYDKPY